MHAVHPINSGEGGDGDAEVVHVLCSLKERNQLVVAAARAEERERQQVQEEIGEVEQHVLAIVPSLEASSDQCKEQVSRWSFHG